MNCFLGYLAVAFCALVMSTAAAEPIAWEDLIDPSAQSFEDPYVDLDYERLEDLVIIARETARMEENDLSDQARDASNTKILAARARLSEAGIDADWLISQRWVVAERRENAATATNPEIDGADVTLGGFAIPAPAEDGTPIVYLVPERGMCSHMPPPNPNQMIRARLSSDWSPSMMHEPVRLSGKLTAEETNESFRIVDGIVPMRSSFVMDVAKVETMPVFSSNIPDTNGWAAKLAEKALAAGQSTSEREEE